MTSTDGTAAAPTTAPRPSPRQRVRTHVCNNSCATMLSEYVVLDGLLSTIDEQLEGDVNVAQASSYLMVIANIQSTITSCSPTACRRSKDGKITSPRWMDSVDNDCEQLVSELNDIVNPPSEEDSVDETDDDDAPAATTVAEAPAAVDRPKSKAVATHKVVGRNGKPVNPNGRFLKYFVFLGLPAVFVLILLAALTLG